ncbi:hypothetical protein BCV69DRAFT_283560 [Microstroma glucosiphilum]|uniref:1-alkyl-2-acetylglycerophosphocholine esterase n=1 Tax=Pseudomicrostroma glucosiphilum TaxID=1684307 RepID=A0A316UAH8_9BASI|nr:hypothetical protein BCV69DRAFT_283560 [Pseudomicrostroma glucosiphilum]PWN20035.1 hypothetical protein BCV69DRAFT_283560 [Pseudomicrostroma glucosiphilum]
MPLPPYKGPFRVGAIDLEIPVRESRAFATDVVSPDAINPPAKHKRSKAGRIKAEPHRLHPRDREGQQTTTASPESSSGSTSARAPASQEDDGEDEDAASKLASWSPFHHGSKTSTLYLSTVLFTLFYPTSLDEEAAKEYRKVAWIGRPKRRGTAAMVDYLGQYGLAGPFAAIPASPALLSLLAAKAPAYGGAPLADTASAAAPPFPVVVFSHGLAGSRLAYSQYCGELASHGIIVAAVEHRDGSGLTSVVRPPLDPGFGATQKEELQRPKHQPDEGKEKKNKARRHHPKAIVPYFDFSTIGLRSFPTEPTGKEIGMRHAQLAMRIAELDECLDILQRIARGEGDQVAAESTRTMTTKLCGRYRMGKPPRDGLIVDPSRLKDWKGKLEIEHPALIGHSFGGATVIEYLKGSSPRFPYGVALDPWVEPITTSNSSSHRPLQAPVYVINSESFTIWSEHFSKVKALVKDLQPGSGKSEEDAPKGWIITLAGAEHLSFSDYPSLLPKVFRSTVTPAKCIEIYSRATLTQMELLGKRLKAYKAGGAGESQRDQAGEEQKDESHARADHSELDADGPAKSSSPEPLVGVIRERTTTEPEIKEKSTTSREEGSTSRADDAEISSPGAPHEPIEPSSPFSNENLHGTTESVDYPQADANVYRGQLEAIEKAPSSSEAGGHTRREHLLHAKDAAAARLMERRQEHKFRREEHEQKKDDEKVRKKKGREVRGVIARRTPSGGMTSLPRASDMQRDYTLDPEHLLPSHKRHPDQPEGPHPAEDVALVVESVRPLADDQKHKSYRKLRSISALLYRTYGMRPGIERPGSILIHEN